jgi:hypothetical protein
MAEGPGRVPDSAGDMRDSADEIAFWAPLELAACAPIAAEFERVDTLALTHQKWHRRLTLGATLSGGLSVLCSVWDLGFGQVVPSMEDWLPWVEVVALAGLILSIGLGLWKERKNQWLINRHKAELYRLARFEFVIHPAIWLKGTAAGEAWVREKLAAIRALAGREALDRSIERALVPDEESDPPKVPSATMLKLVEYYLAKRLNPQKEYLANRAQRNAFWDGWLVRNVTTGLLILSVLASLIQMAVNWAGSGDWTLRNVIFATLGAASLPAVAAMIRSLRLAYEFSRNRSRFMAAHDALSQLEQRLTHHLLWGRSDPAAENASLMLKDLETSEGILRTEHQEWLRLMLEAEWFG